MLSRLNAQVIDCIEHSLLARYHAAEVSNNEVLHNEWIRLAESWEKLRASMELAEQIDGFLQWNAQRLRPPSDWQ